MWVAGGVGTCPATGARTCPEQGECARCARCALATLGASCKRLTDRSHDCMLSRVSVVACPVSLTRVSACVTRGDGGASAFVARRGGGGLTGERLCRRVRGMPDSLKIPDDAFGRLVASRSFRPVELVSDGSLPPWTEVLAWAARAESEVLEVDSDAYPYSGAGGAARWLAANGHPGYGERFARCVFDALSSCLPDSAFGASVGAARVYAFYVTECVGLFREAWSL